MTALHISFRMCQIPALDFWFSLFEFSIFTDQDCRFRLGCLHFVWTQRHYPYCICCISTPKESASSPHTFAQSCSSESGSCFWTGCPSSCFDAKERPILTAPSTGRRRRAPSAALISHHSYHRESLLWCDHVDFAVLLLLMNFAQERAGLSFLRISVAYSVSQCVAASVDSGPRFSQDWVGSMIASHPSLRLMFSIWACPSGLDSVEVMVSRTSSWLFACCQGMRFLILFPCSRNGLRSNSGGCHRWAAVCLIDMKSLDWAAHWPPLCFACCSLDAFERFNLSWSWSDLRSCLWNCGAIDWHVGSWWCRSSCCLSCRHRLTRSCPSSSPSSCSAWCPIDYEGLCSGFAVRVRVCCLKFICPNSCCQTFVLE